MDMLKSLGWRILDRLKKYRPRMFQDLQRQHSGQSRRARGNRKNGACRSGKTIFSMEE